jgi:hypothetical protein
MGLLGGILSGIGSLFGGSDAADAQRQLAEQQQRIAAQQAEAAKFKPVGITSRFGSTNYGYDPSGRLTSAGYTLSPEVTGWQNAISGAVPGMLGQYTGSLGATAPMSRGAQSMFRLGQGYLGESPEAVSQQAMQQQLALLAPSREEQLAKLRANQIQTGRTGLAVGGYAGQMATNPEMAAYYNALANQDMQLAAQARQLGQQNVQFGQGLLTGGGQMLRDMYGTQSASLAPGMAGIEAIKGLEGLGSGMLDTGMRYGSTVTNAAANAANTLAQGQMSAAQLQAQADAYNPLGALFSGAGQALGGMTDFDISKIFGSASGAAPSTGGGLKPASFTVPQASLPSLSMSGSTYSPAFSASSPSLGSGMFGLPTPTQPLGGLGTGLNATRSFWSY